MLALLAGAGTAHAEVTVGPAHHMPCPPPTGDASRYTGPAAPYVCHSAVVDPLGYVVILRRGQSYAPTPSGFGMLHTLFDHNVEPADVAGLAAMLKEDYAPECLETAVSEPTIVENSDGSREYRVPRSQMFEPFRSLHLLDAVAVGDILVVTFRWDDGNDDGTIFLMPLDTHDVELDMHSDTFVRTFVDHHLSWTLGGPRESWEPATTLLSPRLAVVRPYDQRW